MVLLHADIKVLNVEGDSGPVLFLRLKLQLSHELDRLKQVAIRVLSDLALADREKSIKLTGSLLLTLQVRDEVHVVWLVVEAKVLYDEDFVERFACLGQLRAIHKLNLPIFICRMNL